MSLGGSDKPSRYGQILMTVMIFIHIFPFSIGLYLLILGILASEKVSEIKTENIQPLLDVFTVDSVQAVSMVKTLSHILISIGVLLMAAVAGWITFIAVTCFRKKTILDQIRTCGEAVKYCAIIVLILFVLTVVVIALWVPMKSKVETYVQSKMVVALNAHFMDDTITNSNSISNAWNHMFMELDCCGVNPVVSTTNDFDQTTWCTTSGSCQATSSQIPKTCCLNVDENTYTSAPAGCHASVNSGTYNTKGCYAALKERLLRYSSDIIQYVSATIALEIIAVICAFLFLGCYKEPKESQSATVRPTNETTLDETDSEGNMSVEGH